MEMFKAITKPNKEHAGITKPKWVFGYYGVKGADTELEEHCIIQSTLNTSSSIDYFYFTDIVVIP